MIQYYSFFCLFEFFFFVHWPIFYAQKLIPLIFKQHFPGARPKSAELLKKKRLLFLRSNYVFRSDDAILNRSKKLMIIFGDVAGFGSLTGDLINVSWTSSVVHKFFTAVTFRSLSNGICQFLQFQIEEMKLHPFSSVSNKPSFS